MSGVTSPILRERLAQFEVKFGPQRFLTVRSLCGMQTTGNRETPLSVSNRGLPELRVSLPQGLVRNSGGPDLNCRFQALSPARGVVVP